MDHTEAAPGERPGPERQPGLDQNHEPSGLDRAATRLVAEAATEEPDEAGAAEPVDVEPALDYPDPPRTGDAAVDEVIEAVAHAVRGPLEEQLAVYDAAHRTLQDRLADVEG